MRINYMLGKRYISYKIIHDIMCFSLWYVEHM